jgi:protein SCO1
VILRFAPLLAAVLFALPAQAKEYLPLSMQGIDIEEHLGGAVDKSLVFTDHTGQQQTLGQLMEGDVPVLLTLNYYRCAMLCNLQLNALIKAIKGARWVPGDQYRIVTISIDPREGWELGRDKRDSYKKTLGMGDVDWTFAVGAEDQIAALADSLGYRFKYDPDQDQWGHTPAVFFLTTEGTISRYLYGLTYVARDLRFAVLDASEGKIGTSVDRFLMSCFHYDSSIGNYQPFAWGVMRAGGVFIMASLSVLMGFMWRIERRRQDAENLS